MVAINQDVINYINKLLFGENDQHMECQFNNNGCPVLIYSNYTDAGFIQEIAYTIDTRTKSNVLKVTKIKARIGTKSNDDSFNEAAYFNIDLANNGIFEFASRSLNIKYYIDVSTARFIMISTAGQEVVSLPSGKRGNKYILKKGLNVNFCQNFILLI